LIFFFRFFFARPYYSLSNQFRLFPARTFCPSVFSPFPVHHLDFLLLGPDLFSPGRFLPPAGVPDRPFFFLIDGILFADITSFSTPLPRDEISRMLPFLPCVTFFFSPSGQNFPSLFPFEREPYYFIWWSVSLFFFETTLQRLTNFALLHLGLQRLISRTFESFPSQSLSNGKPTFDCLKAASPLTRPPSFFRCEFPFSG